MAGTPRAWGRGRARARGNEPVIIRKLDTLAPRARWRAKQTLAPSAPRLTCRARAGGPNDSDSVRGITAPLARAPAGRGNRSPRRQNARPARARAGGPRQLANAPIPQTPRARARRRASEKGTCPATPGRKLRGHALSCGGARGRRPRVGSKRFLKYFPNCAWARTIGRERVRASAKVRPQAREGPRSVHRTGKTSAGNSPFLSENGRRNYPLAKRASLNFALSDA